MSVINGVIPQQNFEIVHDRIGAILLEELDNQVVLSYNTDLQVEIYKERDLPFGQGELPALNVMMERGEYSGQDMQKQDGMYRFIVEGTFEAKGDDEKNGDTIAMNKLQRLLGVCRAILMDPKYKTLGFAPPFIQNRHIENIYFGRPVRQDGGHTVIGRLTLMVKVAETTELIVPNLIQGFDTTVKLHLTEQGYKWTLDNP